MPPIDYIRRSMVRRRRLFVLLYAASGAAALVYEVAGRGCSRSSSDTPSPRASTVLAAFMGGLALGAWLAGASAGVRARFADVRRRSKRRSSRVFALLLPLALRRIRSGARVGVCRRRRAALRFAFVRVASALLLLGVPAAAMGATFPIAVGWCAREQHADAGVLSTPRTRPAPRSARSPPASG